MCRMIMSFRDPPVLHVGDDRGDILVRPQALERHAVAPDEAARIGEVAASVSSSQTMPDAPASRSAGEYRKPSTCATTCCRTVLFSAGPTRLRAPSPISWQAAQARKTVSPAATSSGSGPSAAGASSSVAATSSTVVFLRLGRHVQNGGAHGDLDAFGAIGHAGFPENSGSSTSSRSSMKNASSLGMAISVKVSFDRTKSSSTTLLR
jgi:hypothetical protein